MRDDLTPEFRVSWPKVFKAEENTLNGRMEYSVTALFPKGADLSGLKRLCVAALEKKFGANKDKWPQNLRLPFRDQAEKAKKDEQGVLQLPDGHEAEAVFLTLRTTRPVGVINHDKRVLTEPQEFYAGCYARAQVNAYAYDQGNNKGVNLGLNNLQKLRNGDPLAGAGVNENPENVFEAVADPDAGSGQSAQDINSLM